MVFVISWVLIDNLNVWEFKFCEGVKFYGGEDFIVDDVVFFFKCVMMLILVMKELLNFIMDVCKVDDFMVYFEINGLNLLLLNNMMNLFIMDFGWVIDNGCEVL